MKKLSSFILLFFILCCLFLGCSDSPTDIQDKTDLIIREWKGEEFFLIVVNDSTFTGKDFVETFEFKNDGSYFLYKYSMSSMGIIGQWVLEDDGDRIKFSQDDANFDVFSIVELSPKSFVFGDTTLHGYKLVSK